ncbi:hypothetical protein [Staphylococcus aureus]|uniref:hypothetical protein n=1 Tax=Staphylococcus aureus TaxID=1280 RepID=UPI00215C5318|nr:hypothetical protein [Staphylococcus aureus]UVJ08044.1 hypothetical protein NW971_00135 [Staphylococcus aureus]
MEQIETLYENINKKEIKKYFREVLISYQNGSYRSAIVMLYSVVISDIIYKLKDMDSIFNDEKAKKILEDIQDKQSRNPNSPEWEIVLIEEVRNQTKLINPLLYENIIHLKHQRNLSAHPVIDNNNMLVSPSREDVIAQIRNMLEQLLVKPAIFTRDVEKQFIIDLAENKEYLIDDYRLERYIEKNYLQHFDDYIVKKIFEKLWKFTFKLNNEEAKINRDINYRAIQIIFKSRKELLSESLKGDFIQSHTSFDDVYIVNLLVIFISKNDIFKNFDEFTKDKLNLQIEKNENLAFISYFINDNLFNHLEVIEKKLDNNHRYNEITKEYTEILHDICKNQGVADRFLNLLIEMFKYSRSFDESNKNFDAFIKPFLSYFDTEQFKKILTIYNVNGQINGRNRAEEDLKMIYKNIMRNKITINSNEYMNLKEMLDAFKMNLNE